MSLNTCCGSLLSPCPYVVLIQNHSIMLARTLCHVVSGLVTLAAAYTNPLACSGTCTDTHDPSMIRRSSDGTYFRFATGGLIPIFTSPALTGPWTAAGQVLSADANVDNSGNDDLWVSRRLTVSPCLADLSSRLPTSISLDRRTTVSTPPPASARKTL